MLGSLVRHGLSQRQCEAEVPLAVVAGSDTTAGVMRGTLLHVITNPRVYQRLQTEIDESVATGRVSSPITQAQAKTLPYLQVS
jgi:cytochrome P450